jgi:hypothetical protein
MKVETIDGLEQDLDELLDTYLPDDVAETSLLCADMDGTMFENDIGLLVFLEKLSDPTLWAHSEDRFARLLLPKKYFELLKEGAKGRGGVFEKEDCWIALTLHKDILELYKLQKRKLKYGNGSTLNINSAVVNEFAYKMIALDAIILKLDKIFAGMFDGQLLLRTRHFAAKSKAQVHSLVERVMSRDEDSDDSIVTVNIHEENRKEAKQVLTEDLLRRCRVDNAFDRVVREVEDVRKIIARVVCERDAHGRVVSTNLDLIVQAAIFHSKYQKILRPAEVIATTQYVPEENGNGVENRPYRLQAKVNGLPIFGAQKAEAANRLAATKGLTLRFALGDSNSNDGPMMESALTNYGIAVLVGKTRAKIIQEFRPLLERTSSFPEISGRILCVSTET